MTLFPLVEGAVDQSVLRRWTFELFVIILGRFESVVKVVDLALV